MNRVSNEHTTAMHCCCVNRWMRTAGLLRPGAHDPHFHAGTHAPDIALNLMEQGCDVAYSVLLRPLSSASSVALLCTLVNPQICKLAHVQHKTW